MVLAFGRAAETVGTAIEIGAPTGNGVRIGVRAGVQRDGGVQSEDVELRTEERTFKLNSRRNLLSVRGSQRRRSEIMNDRQRQERKLLALVGHLSRLG